MPRLDQRRRNTATHPAFILALIRGKTVYSSGQSVYRGRREGSAQLGEWRVTIYIQLVTKPVQGFARFQPESATSVRKRIACGGSSYRRGSVAVSMWAERSPEVS